ERRLHLHLRQHRPRDRPALDAPVRHRRHPSVARADPGLDSQQFHGVAAVLQTRRERGVVYLTLSEPVALGPESDRLAWQLVDACRAIAEDDQQPVAVALVGRDGAFFTVPPRSAADCDAASSGWRAATAAVAGLG